MEVLAKVFWAGKVYLGKNTWYQIHFILDCNRPKSIKNNFIFFGIKHRSSPNFLIKIQKILSQFNVESWTDLDERICKLEINTDSRISKITPIKFGPMFNIPETIHLNKEGK